MDQKAIEGITITLDAEASTLLSVLAGTGSQISEFASKFIKQTVRQQVLEHYTEIGVTLAERRAEVARMEAELATMEARIAAIQIELAELRGSDDLTADEETGEILAHPELAALLQREWAGVQAGEPGVPFEEVKRMVGL